MEVLLDLLYSLSADPICPKSQEGLVYRKLNPNIPIGSKVMGPYVNNSIISMCE